VANAATCTAHSRVDLGVANGGRAGAAKEGVAGRDGAVGRAGSTGRVNDSAYAGCARGTFSGSRDDSGGMNVPGGCGKLKGTGEAELIWRKAMEQNPNLPLAFSFLAGAETLKGDTVSATAFEDQAARSTPNDPLFHWMLGLRLKNLEMNELANEHFNRAIAMNPEFRRALN